MSESIYNLIPKPKKEVVKAPIHRSTYNPKEVAPKDGSHFSDFNKASQKRTSGTMGAIPGTQKQKPDQFLKKKSKTTVTGVSKPGTKPKKFVRADPIAPKPKLPSKDDAPMCGLTSETNFITQNAVDNILAEPKNKPVEEPNWWKKEDFGKTPAYLQQVKKEISEEYQFVEQMQQEEDEEIERQTGFVELTDDEKAEILKGLKKNYDELNKIYLSMPVAVDTEVKKRRKERLEQELAQLEKDIEHLSKKHVFVQE